MKSIQRKLIEIPAGCMAGWFKFEAVKRDGTRRLLADWFPNLITDAGLNGIGTVGNYLGECRVGTGSATPDVLDTALAAQVAASTTIHDTVSAAEAAPPYFGSITNVYRFAEGVAAGNLAEVGIGITAGTLFSRALILDGLGAPTTITVAVDEVLDVTYQLRLYPPLIDVADTIVISAVSYDYTLRASRVTDVGFWAPTAEIGGGYTAGGAVVYDDVIGAITAGPSGTSSGAISTTNDAYSNNSLQGDFTCVWGLDQGNFGGGIKSVECRFGQNQARFGANQIEFDPVIPKDNTMVLTLGFRHVWARKTLP